MGDTAALERELRRRVRGRVDFGDGARGVYAYDASNYRQVPLGVVAPAGADDVRAALALAREAGVPVLARGAGTSIGGQAVSPGALVLDFRPGMRRIGPVDAAARTVRVEPGVVLDDLQRAAAAHGLGFGPDPSTHSRATLGGMIGNDSCGAHSVAWGRTADNVRELELLLADGAEFAVGGPSTAEERRVAGERGGREGEVRRELERLAAENLALLRTAFPRLPRRVSGFALDALLPERGFDLARALTGTEGSCALLLGATVALHPLPRARMLVVAGYADESAAAEAVAELLPLRPLTAEGMGADLVRDERAREALPAGRGWLFLEADGREHAEAIERAVRGQGASVRLLTDPGGQRRLWRVREAAAGTATRAPDGSEAWPGWEDSAVPPWRLGPYLRELRQLTARHGLRGVPYGHFGEGCVHLRLDFPLDTRDGRGAFRRFLEEAADLVVAHGGSLSGEHGDGQARGELLGRMYPPEVLELFARFKRVFDPEGLLNPGNVVAPRALDADLRVARLPRELPLADGARRCVGVGACVAERPVGVMCPSYAATGDERHSTRGRARLLGELVDGRLLTGRHGADEVREALDLCLSCKGCAVDCPVHVDMATYKSLFLDRYYARRLRPRSHWALGGLPSRLRWLHRVPGAARLVNLPAVSALVRRAAGTERERPLPRVAPRPFTRGFRPRPGERRVLLWPDTFGNHLEPEVLEAGVAVLRYAGFEPVLPVGPVCCGLTWVTTGQLAAARRVLRRTLRVLGSSDPELPVVVLEPSCAAALREELPRYLPDDPAARQLADRVRTLEQFLAESVPAGTLPLPEGPVLTQVHCHEHAVLRGQAADPRSGMAGTEIGGCCGLAGNFAFERGHHAVSVAVAEQRLLPALRAAAPGTAVRADGYSCRTQIRQLGPAGSAAPLHLAQLLQQGLPENCKDR
ncbi:FAD-binding and (Fe-S)-binding domain-containing protein [Streptacidiphilus monticola]|uniref:FAD-binding and (Fe-S)-binding domain-containing protein n=1 Tax=Streptacidiphilus monticola TaxID=2161674 RepID=A0ABW1G8C8_9ACTN